MRLHCNKCGAVVSNEVPDGTVLSGWIECPECTEKTNVRIATEVELMSAEGLAQFFHETYERLSPSHGYETRKESAKPWSEVPQKNKSLMIAVCEEVLLKMNPD